METQIQVQTQKVRGNGIKIIIGGGGFGGITCARLLARKARKYKLNAEIILADRNNYHLYYPNLYEVATSEEEFVSIGALKKSIALPYAEILPKGAAFMQGEISEISPENKTVKIGGAQLNFDYLVLAFGSVTDYCGIKGLQEHALVLKSIPDALRIRNRAEFAVQAASQDFKKKLLRIIIGGGGFSGVELAGEMLNLIQILSWKYNYPREKIELLIIEGSNQLLPGMPLHISEWVCGRLKKLGAQIRLENFVAEADRSSVFLNTGEKINYDLLVWTGGVRSADIPFDKAMPSDKKGRLLESAASFCVQGCDFIFAIGDDAHVPDLHNVPVPQTATQAIYEAEYIAEAVMRKARAKQVPPFRPRAFGYIIPVKGKWAVLHLPSGLTWYGFLSWVARRFADLRYFSKLLPFGKAVRMAWFDTELYVKNDE